MYVLYFEFEKFVYITATNFDVFITYALQGVNIDPTVSTEVDYFSAGFGTFY